MREAAALLCVLLFLRMLLPYCGGSNRNRFTPGPKPPPPPAPPDKR
jgi:hypothetical protein